MYAIKASYYYQSNTYRAPKSGYLRNEGRLKNRNSNTVVYPVITFGTRAAALEYLEDSYGKMMLVSGKNTYMYKGNYVLNYGEYAEPQFTIVKYTKRS